MRAIAILSVLTFHTGLYSNGLFGVDVFFVLSGFLITLTLLRDYHRHGWLRLARFYAHRAKRLLPMLVLILAATLWAVLALGDAATRERFGAQALAALVYWSNWEQIGAGQSYWEGFGRINPLGHMWSLAITEQFYLVWPVLLLAVLVLGRKRSDGAARAWQRSSARPILVLAIAAAGTVVAAIQPMLRYDGTNSDRLYLGTDTHAVGLFAGALAAAVLFLRLRARASRGAGIRRAARVEEPGALFRAAVTAVSILAAVALVALAIDARDYSQAWLYQWGFAVVAVLAGVLVLTLTTRANLLTRALSIPPLVEIGKVSYTAFLVHLPIYWIILAVAPGSEPIDLLILGVPAALLAAGALHHLVAEPLRLRPWRRVGGTVFAVVTAAVAAAVLVLPGIVPLHAAGSGSTRVLTLGDSLANDFASTLSAHAADGYAVVDGGIPGCGIAGSTAQRTAVGITQQAAKGCSPWQSRWEALIEQHEPDVILVNIAWDAVLQEIDGEWVDLTDPGFAARYEGQLRRMAQLLDDSDAQVVVANSRLHNAVVTPEQAAAFNGLLERALDGTPISVFDLQTAVCSADDCPSVDGEGRRLYLDDRVHFSGPGMEMLAPKLVDAIEGREAA